VETQPPGLFGLLPFFIMTIGIAFLCRRLAEDKGRNVNLWTVLAIIPLVNLFALPFLVGATNLLLDRKLDTIIALLERNEKSDPDTAE